MEKERGKRRGIRGIEKEIEGGEGEEEERDGGGARGELGRKE